MLAENTTTPHNRTIRLTNISGLRDGESTEMLITVTYVKCDGVFQAVTLDNVVIPAIIEAINKHN